MADAAARRAAPPVRVSARSCRLDLGDATQAAHLARVAGGTPPRCPARAARAARRHETPTPQRPAKLALPTGGDHASDIVLPHPSLATRSGGAAHYPSRYASTLPPPRRRPPGPAEAAGAVAAAIAAGVVGVAAAAAAAAADAARGRRPRAAAAAAAQLLALASLAAPPAAASAAASALRSLAAGAQDWTAGTHAAAADNARVHTVVFASLARAGPFVRACLLAAQIWLFLAWLPLALLAPRFARSASAVLDAALAAALAVAARRAVPGGSLAAWADDGGAERVPDAAASYWRPRAGAGVRSVLLAARADAVARALATATTTPSVRSPVSVGERRGVGGRHRGGRPRSHFPPSKFDAARLAGGEK